jgi:SpoVK/Ycf46/Vps4 family AAA+-type ATPase
LDKDGKMKKQMISSPLGSLAVPIEPHHTWEDLVLTKTKSATLHEIVDKVRTMTNKPDLSRENQGVLAIFTGQGATTKRIAIQAIANDVGLDLYHVDLSAVVSKYISETEKNLNRLFDAAEGSGAILFFDEADALFGKRSEVKDSHDRYTNLEISPLLQRMEAYRGLAILATNMKSSLDSAFLRRLRFIVNFPVPKASERKLIWQSAFDNKKDSTKREADGGTSP